MPGTPFHFGPGFLIKSILRKRFSFSIFVLTQIIIDCEVLWNILRENERWHTFFHSYLGSNVAIVLVSILTVIFKSIFKKSRFIRDFYTRLNPQYLNWNLKTIIISAAIGAWSHVFLDSLMHPDMAPLSPLMHNNFMLDRVSFLFLHLGCLIAAVMGAIIW